MSTTTDFTPSTIVHSVDTFRWESPTIITATHNESGRVLRWEFASGPEAAKSWLAVALH